MHEYIHTYIHTNIYTYIHTCINACMHIYILTYIHARTHAYIKYMHTYIDTYIHASAVVVVAEPINVGRCFTNGLLKVIRFTIKYYGIMNIKDPLLLKEC